MKYVHDMLEIIVIITLLFLLIETLYLLSIRVSKNKRDKLKSPKISVSEHSEIDTTREKKEVKKKAIKNWKREHERTRKHFAEKKRKERKDKGKRRDKSGLVSGDTPSKRGKPKGSPGSTWRKPPAEEIDKDVHLYPKKCLKCGSEDLKKAGTWEHYLEDLVPIKRGMKLVITRYIIHRSRCKKCKKLVSVDFGILKNCHFGFGFIATVMQSRIESRHSYSQIWVEFSRWIPGWDRFISKTTIVDWFKKYGAYLEEFYLECVNKLKESKYVHADETGFSMKGKNWWLWVITTTFFTLFIPSVTRGRKAIEDLFKDFKGVLISDFWGAYNNLTLEQQKCLAHLVKDLKMLVTKSEDSINRIEKRLKEDAKQKEQQKKGVKDERKRGRPKKQPEPLSAEKREALGDKKRREAKKIEHALLLYYFFRQAWYDEDNPLSYKARPEIRATPEEALEQLRALIKEIEADDAVSPDIKRLIKRILRYENYLFTYLKHPGIPPDNNAAERELRPFVIMRKTSHNFNSEEVMDSFTLYLSFYQTCKKNGVDFSKALKSVLSGETKPVLTAIGF